MSNTYDTPVAAPITQEEPEGMSMVRSVFERASNAIVEASRLSKEIAEIRTQLDAIKREVEEVQRRNRELDEMLTTTRQQRDEARGKLYDTERELAAVRSQLAMATDQLNTSIAKSNNLSDLLDKKSHDYDQAMDLYRDADKAKTEAEQRLKDIEEFAGRAFGLVRPTPSPTAPANPVPSTDGGTVGSVESEPQAAVEEGYYSASHQRF